MFKKKQQPQNWGQRTRASYYEIQGHIGELLDLYEQPLHARANIWLGEERTGSFHPQHAEQHPEPFLQQVGRVRFQVVNTLPRHYLHKSEKRNGAGEKGKAEIP